MQLRNKVLLGLMTLFVSSMAIITIMLGLYSQKKNNYVFLTENVKDNIYINELFIGDSVVKLYDFVTDKNFYVKEQQKIALSNEENYALKISKIDNLRISFENKSDDKCTITIMKNSKKIKTITLQKDSNYIFTDNFI